MVPVIGRVTFRRMSGRHARLLATVAGLDRLPEPSTDIGRALHRFMREHCRTLVRESAVNLFYAMAEMLADLALGPLGRGGAIIDHDPGHEDADE